MSLFYRIAYRFGFTPWEEASRWGPAATRIAALLDRETAEHPAGSRALDLGCGRGHWTLELARRGWAATGIDRVPRAISAARARAAASGQPAAFVVGDVTRLRDAGIAPPVAFFWDFGTLHGLTPAAWAAAGREITAVAARRATLVTLAWARAWRGPLPRGAGAADIAAALPGWRIVDEGAFDASGLPRPLRGVAPRWYRLRREAGPPEGAA